MANKHSIPETWHKDLHIWSRSRLGKAFIELECECLQKYLPTQFGRHFVHLGLYPRIPIIEQCPVYNLIHLIPDKSVKPKPEYVFATGDALPFESDTVNAVLAQHYLEFCDDPHEVLRECHRILIPEGRLMICCFNQRSLWGLWRYVARHFTPMPWRGRFYSVERIKDWLSLLGFDDIHVHYYFFRPPIPNTRMQEWLQGMEKMSSFAMIPGGASYIITAKKRVSTLTPLPSWQKLGNSVIIPGMAPTASPRTRIS